MPASAEIHQCTAADGSVQFSDVPCGAKARAYKPAGPADNHGEYERNEQRDRLLRAYEQERQEKREAAAAAEKKQQERVRRCARARDYLRNMTRAGSVYDLDDAGNRVYLDKSQRAEVMSDARARVKRWCD